LHIYFYLSQEYWIEPIPNLKTLPKLSHSGQHSWVTQTYLHLKESDIKCSLVKELPTEGIIIFHKGSLAENYIPNKRQLLVCIQADWGRHSFAQRYICQNRKQASYASIALEIPRKTYFVHFWSQSDIIKRNPKRSSTFSNISYYGIKDNLADELKSADWIEFLDSHGIEWSVVEEREKWGDYFSADVVLFCRDFKGSPFHFKPATKLYNTWIAECLPIFTPESAFMDEMVGNENSGIVISNYAELKQRIINLNNSPDEFRQMIENGKQLGQNYSNKKITQEWLSIIKHLEESLEKQLKSPLRFLAFIYIRKLMNLVKKFILAIK